MSLVSYLKRRRSTVPSSKRVLTDPSDKGNAADPDDDLASRRYTRHASSEEFLASLEERT